MACDMFETEWIPAFSHFVNEECLYSKLIYRNSRSAIPVTAVSRERGGLSVALTVWTGRNEVGPTSGQRVPTALSR